MSPHILIVDDAADQRHILKAFTQSFLPQAKITTLDEVEPALEALGKSSVQLIVLDLHFKERSGQDVLRAAKAMLPPIPVLMVTGDKSEETLQNLFAWGADDYILKPVDNLIFESKVRSLLTGRYMSPLAFLGKRGGLGSLSFKVPLQIKQMSEYEVQLGVPYYIFAGAKLQIQVGPFTLACRVLQTQAAAVNGIFDVVCDIDLQSISDRPAFRRFLMGSVETQKAKIS